jgi:CHAT domain-containing protein/tetratricopeptide (TPR) repeat protein
MLAGLPWSASALLIFVALGTIQSSSAARAQQSDDLKMLQQQVQQLDQVGRYAEALAISRKLVAETEKAETASAGKPGAATFSALVNLAWCALLAHDFKDALAASDRAHALAPTNLYAEGNRAHALLLLGHVREARAIYFFHKGKPMSLTSDALWEDVIADDVEALVKAGVNQPALKGINAELGGKSGGASTDPAELDQKIQELVQAGNYKDAEAAAQRYAALVRQRYSEGHPKDATAFHWLGFTIGHQGRYAEAEPLLKRALAIWEKALGPDHADVAVDLNDLAFLYGQQGRYAEAEPLFKRSLTILEKAYGLESLEFALTLNNLGLLYRDEKRYAEAEPLIKRGLAIREKQLGPWHIDVARSVNSLAVLYHDMGRYDEQEKLLERSVAIREKVLTQTDPDLATALDNLALFYTDRKGLFSKAEPLAKRALAIYTAAYGPFHPDVAITTHNLVSIYRSQRRWDEVEKLLTQTLDIYEKTVGPKDPRVAEAANELADFYFDKGNFSRATDLWRRSAAITSERALRDANEIARPLAVGGQKANIEFNTYFTSLLKAAFRVSEQNPKAESALAREMFEIAQWAQNSEAALSLTNMAARGAKGSPALEAMIRDRQGLVEIWRELDENQMRLLSLPPDQRNRTAEEGLATQVADVVQRISAIDKKITTDFREYSSLASPAPISVEAAQLLLGPDEALVLILDTDRWREAPEELFVWVVTKTEVRWTKNAFAGPPFGGLSYRFFGEGANSITTETKNANVAGAVKALRCGLDNGLWEETKGDPCKSLLVPRHPRPGASTMRQQTGIWLPFDVARSHSLYQAIFGGSEDLIKGKHLLIVPSGPLAQLPFQVLVTSLPKGITAGEFTYEPPYLAVRLENLTAENKHRLNWTGTAGVRIITFGTPAPYIRGQALYSMSASGFARSHPSLPKNPAETAGIRPGDILAKIEDEEVTTAGEAEKKIRDHPAQTPLHLVVWRDGGLVTVDAALLGQQTMIGWKPLYLKPDAARDTPWLVRDHAITILPAVSSLSALRSLARPSSATKPMIGFGNPLLEGPNSSYGTLAKAAREHQVCEELNAPLQTEAISTLSRTGGLDKINKRGGLADVSSILKAPPLPETAEELCAVARYLKANQSDIFLGARATESEIKRMSDGGQLAQYRIVHFATHGARAGELNGSDEPGLILTPPTTASQQDDGYLSASEIAGLRLDADWVILSACNTAAGGFKGAEVFSGLARAFFYAKARSLLVSHWEVSSDSTVRLITKAIAELKADPKIGRAEALRRSMMSMIANGKSYEAHPTFWAPFVLVGEGGPSR